MSKLAIFGLATLVAVASAQCDWSLVDQTACQNSNTQQDCFPPGWPTCGGAANGAGGSTGTDGGQTIADILPASCNEVDFLKCFYEYPDLENYLNCVHPEPCSCAGDFKVLECADAHCTDKSEYPEVLTSNIAECRAKGKHTFVSSEGHGSSGVKEDVRKETTQELRRRQNGPGGGLLTGEDVFPIGPSCTETTLTPCLNGLAQEYETCVDPFAPCLCSALFDIQRCYTASCTSQEDQPTIVTNNIVYCPKNETPGIGLPPPPPPAEPTVPTTSIDVVNPSTSAVVVAPPAPPPTSTGRSPTATIQPTGTTTLVTTTLLISYIAPPAPLPTRSPLSPITPVSTISLTSTSTSTSTSSTNTYRQIELTSTTSTTTQVVVATTRSVDDKGISTSTELVPSTTVTAQTTTTSTAASTGAAATMNMEMGIAGVAAAAMGFAALL